MNYYNTYARYSNRDQLAYQYEKYYNLYHNHPDLFNNKKVLDFGAGFGELSFLLKDSVKSIDVYDPSKANNDILKRIFKKSGVGIVEKQQDLYMNYYDTVLIICVLEMVSDYKSLLNTLIRNMVGKTFIIMNSTITDRNMDFTPNETRLYTEKTCNKFSDVDIYGYNYSETYPLILHKKDALHNVKEVFVIDSLDGHN